MNMIERATAAAREALGIGDAPDLVVRCRVVSAEAVARAVAKEVLAAQLEAVACSVVAGEENDYWGCCDITEARKFLAHFARENGLEPPAS